MAGHGRDDDELSTVAQPRLSVTPPPRASFELTIEEDGATEVRTFLIDGSAPSRVLVGTSPSCEVRLSDRAVSRRHFALELGPRGLRLTDLGSKNGTFVGDLEVEGALLGGGETLRLGAARIHVRRAKASPTVLSKETSFGRLVGASREMRRLHPLCKRLADANVPVVLEGETGTGKEVLAETLHEMGPRANGPFVVFDCTAVPPSLVESELFGHERGAFTGAVSTRAGVFEQAHGGTLLIDEIGDLDSSLQPKLLRALERCEVRRVGGNEWIRVDVRVLAATRRDLDREVQEGRFRDDLYHRLAVARIELPPLRERQGDVALLARKFVKDLGGDERLLTNEVLAKWDSMPWPGNVRQLRNTVARHVALGDLTLEDAEAPPPELAQADADYMDRVVAEGLPLVTARERVVKEFERRYVESVLAKHGGNVVRAAAASGIARRYFQILRAKVSPRR